MKNLFLSTLAVLSLILLTGIAMAEPVVCDSCSGYPEGAFMRSGGVENGGQVGLLSCQSGIWVDKRPGPADPCAVCGTPPAAGTTCRDGTIYAGLSPDGGGRMYAMPTDVTRSWSNGSTNGPDTAMQNCDYPARTNASCRTGRANTTLLVGLTNAVSPYQAATYCENLVSNGYSDWYLPSINELVLLYTNLGPAPNNGLKNDWYWSSSEYYSEHAFTLEPGGVVGTASKFGENQIRCVRR